MRRKEVLLASIIVIDDCRLCSGGNQVQFCLNMLKNPYGCGGNNEKFVEILKRMPLDDVTIKTLDDLNLKVPVIDQGWGL